MKVEINEEGLMSIIPESKEDDKALVKWYFTYSHRVCKEVIRFKRTKQVYATTKTNETGNT